jgi:hypothetical protein
MVAVSLMIILVSSSVSQNMRYTVDFFWMMVIAANLCAGILFTETFNKGPDAAAVVSKLHCAAAILSCIILFGWDMIGESNYIWRRNPVVVRYISDMFMFF